MAQQPQTFTIDDEARGAAGEEDQEEAPEEASEEEEEEEGEEEELDVSSPAPSSPSANGASHRSAPKPPKPRGKKKNNASAPRATQPRKWPSDLEQMWLAVLKELPAWKRDPSEVRIQVWIMRGVGVQKPRKLEPKIYGDTVLGDEPGQALMDRVIDEFHIRTRNTTQMPTSYQLRFVLSDGSWIGQSEVFDLDPYEVLERSRRGRGGPAGFEPPYGGPGYGPPQGFGAAPPGQGYRGYGSPPPYASPPYGAPAYYPEPARYPRSVGGQQGHGPGQQPPPPPMPGEPVEVSRMRDENIFLRGQLQKLSDEMAAIRDGRSFDPPPPLPTPALSATDIATAIVTALQATGIGQPHPQAQPPVGAGAAQPQAAAQPAAAATPAAANPVQQMIENAFGSFMQLTLRRAMGSMQQSLESTGTAPSATAAATVEPPPNDDEDLPFKTSPIPEAKWPDGRPVIYPRNKETGKLDLTGAIMANPYIAEKGMELASSVVEVGKDVLRRMASNGEPHIVGQIPASAADGTPQAESTEQPPAWQRQPI